MVKFSLGEHNALQLKLIDVDKKLVEKQWKLYTNSLGKSDKKKGELITKGVILDGLTNSVDWYMKLDKNKKYIILELCVISNEEFLSSSNQSSNYKIIENYLNNFVFVVEKAKVKNEFESEKKTLAKLQKKLKKLTGDYSKKLKSIEKNTKKIKSIEKDNKSNLKKQAETKGSIFKQGLIMEEILSSPSDSTQEGIVSPDTQKGEVSPEYKESNKRLLKLQKLLEKLVDDYNDNLKSIDKSFKKIEKAEKDNKSNLRDQTKIKKQITEQGQTVETLRKQFESMR
jgi:hypothetical protein